MFVFLVLACNVRFAVCFPVDVESAVIKLDVLIPLLTTWLTCDGISCPFLQLKSFEEMTDHIKTKEVYVNPDACTRLEN